MDQETVTVVSLEIMSLSVALSLQQPPGPLPLLPLHFHIPATTASSSSNVCPGHYRGSAKSRCCAYRPWCGAMPAGCSLLPKATLPSPSPSRRSGSPNDGKDTFQSGVTGRVRCFLVRNLAERRL